MSLFLKRFGKWNIGSILLMILGAFVFIFGSIQMNKSSQEQTEISQFEENDQTRRPLIGPVRKRMSMQAAETKQEKLSQAEQKIAVSETSAKWMCGIGIIVFLIGLVYFLASLFRRRT